MLRIYLRVYSHYKQYNTIKNNITNRFMLRIYLRAYKHHKTMKYHKIL
jgi:hypothetical protein